MSEDFAVCATLDGQDMFANCDSLPNFNGVDNASMANYKTGYLTLHRYFNVGGKPYAAYGYANAVCRDDIAFGDEDELSSNFDFSFDFGNTASYERSITSNWATLCLPFSFSTEGNAAQFYSVSSVGGEGVTARLVSGEIAAGTPLLVYTTESSIAISSTGAKAVKEPVDATFMKGTFTTTNVDNADNNYIIAKNKFWQVSSLMSGNKADAVKIAPYRAYVTTASAGSKSATLEILGGDTDGINSINALGFLDGAELYDVQGHRLTSSTKGIVIVKKGNATRKMMIK